MDPLPPLAAALRDYFVYLLPLQSVPSAGWVGECRTNPSLVKTVHLFAPVCQLTNNEGLCGQVIQRLARCGGGEIASPLL